MLRTIEYRWNSRLAVYFLIRTRPPYAHLASGVRRCISIIAGDSVSQARRLLLPSIVSLHADTLLSNRTSSLMRIRVIHTRGHLAIVGSIDARSTRQTLFSLNMHEADARGSRASSCRRFAISNWSVGRYALTACLKSRHGITYPRERLSTTHVHVSHILQLLKVVGEIGFYILRQRRTTGDCNSNFCSFTIYRK